MQAIIPNGLNEMHYSDCMLLEESIGYFNNDGVVQFQQEATKQTTTTQYNDSECVLL